MSINLTLNPHKICCWERGGRPANNCVSLGCTHKGADFGIRGPSLVASCLRRMLDGSLNLRLSVWTGSKDSKHVELYISCIFCYSAPIFHVFPRFSWTKTDSADSAFSLGIQGTVSSHKPQPLSTCRPSDTRHQLLYTQWVPWSRRAHCQVLAQALGTWGRSYNFWIS